MSVPGYASYRDSGVEWLGEVPRHWQVRRLKHVADVFPSNVDKKSYDDGTPVRLCNYTDVYYNDIIADDPEFMLATATADQVAKFTLRAGDTIITKDSETADDIASAAYVPADMPGVVCGYHLSMIRPHADVSGAFIKRYFDSAFAKASVHVRANGLTRVGLGQYAVDNLDLPLPPPPEQAAIVAFLDRETSKIDALVEAQRRLIELLKEKRQAVISHAVTKGLDPASRLKDSGVEWLGKVPAHWQVRKFTHAISVQEGPGIMAVDFVDAGVPLLRVAGAQGRWASLKGCNFLDPEKVATRWKRFRLNEGDLVISGSASTGTVCEVGPEVVGAVPYTGLMRLVPISGLTQKAFVRALVSSDMFFIQIDQLKAGAIIQHFGPTHLARMVVTVPPIEEQEQIAHFVEQALGRYAGLVREAERGIRLLRERRAALISSAITGKIDVRGLVLEQAEAA